MTISTLEAPPVRQIICPHCGRPINTPCAPRLRPILETAARLLAGVVLALMLAPLGILAWKACANILSDGASHSIFYHPLEDWTRY